MTVPPVESWEEIARYVEGVARQAFLRGFSEGWHEAQQGVSDDVYRRALAAVSDYVRSGFDAETVRQFHPNGERRRR